MPGKTIHELAVGDSASHSRTITDDDVAHFAEMIGDTNPLHLDEAAAARSVYGRRIVHGMLTAGLISTVLGTQLPGDGCVYASQDLKFVAPVYHGDTIRATVTVTEINIEKNRCRLATVCTNQAGEEVITGSALVKPRK